MHSALELRAPFLDQSVMEFALALTERQRVKGLNTKAFLKSYATQYLPKEIIYRKKRGLSVPFSSWLRGPLKDWAASALDNTELEKVGISCISAQHLFKNHLEKKADNGRALWAVIVMSEWLDWRARRSASV
jgi:asparagine synthase (glutamine-hydrolysing)